MLITFKSQASSDVMMFGENAQELLRILDKEPNALMGVITVEQLPEAISRLKAAVTSGRATDSAVNVNDVAEEDPDELVSLRQRASPFIEMLEFSLVEKQPVTWGV